MSEDDGMTLRPVRRITASTHATLHAQPAVPLGPGGPAHP